MEQSRSAEPSAPSMILALEINRAFLVTVAKADEMVLLNCGVSVVGAEGAFYG